ncbi:MAG: Haloacid dehalogenase [Candidatus Roizmanbacteria bacterium GW2011_GWC2_37_13]|uniref:Haloacid dehalogenase n=1 Tax=Candidatus Roizmanbacteria bacterium GW2011_GWC2_37_13 TaxID=1618486 RepID=A0A0G0IQQ7_9BACT|nr:MAG: Haloacid dehalogenase [Candidatus Roizmanbacteria bacterium GW2011_GWC1_37_12]KKQ26524.1 MAG: Haloacid dehalogenase [Candidatus Roizmanbacteria bacterium GW2011_GWC2_37_13]
MKKIKFIYFDIGGVMNDWSDSFRTVTSKFKINFEEFNKLWSGKIWDDITRGKISPQDVWKLAIKKFGLKNADNYNFVESWMGDYRPRLEVHELARQLSKKYKIGLISNLYKGMMPRLIEKGMVTDIKYSVVVLSYEVGFRKPEREIYKLATNLVGVKEEEILLIDDRKDFIEGAKKSGWQTFWFGEKNVKESVFKLSKLLL